MWKVLKAELQYHYKTPLIITACIIVWLFIIFSFSGESQLEEDLIGFMIVAMSTTGVSWFVMIMNKHITKRERIHAGLPVSSRLVGVSRLLTVVVFWSIIALSLCLTLLTLRPDIQAGDIFWKFISFTGVILFFNADYTMSRDLYYCFTGKSKTLGVYNEVLPTILLPFLNALILLYFAIPHAFHFSAPLRTPIVNVIFSPSGALLLNVIGCGMLYLSVAVYVRRKSFLA